jgi:hypothetical protein
MDAVDAAAPACVPGEESARSRRTAIVAIVSSGMA